MSAHVHLSPDDFPILGGLVRQAAAARPRAEAVATTPDPVEFTRCWASAQLSVRAYLNSFLSDRSAIDDCIQEVALLAWKKGPHHAGPDAFLGFSLACAKRIAMGEIRKKYRTRLRLLSPETVSSLADAVAALEEREVRDSQQRIASLRSCLDALDPEPRRLLELRYATADTQALQKEAKATGRTLDAIYKRLERLRALLRDCVAGKAVQE